MWNGLPDHSDSLGKYGLVHISHNSYVLWIVVVLMESSFKSFFRAVKVDILILLIHFFEE